MKRKLWIARRGLAVYAVKIVIANLIHLFKNAVYKISYLKCIFNYSDSTRSVMSFHLYY